MGHDRHGHAFWRPVGSDSRLYGSRRQPDQDQESSNGRRSGLGPLWQDADISLKPYSEVDIETEGTRTWATWRVVKTDRKVSFQEICFEKAILDRPALDQHSCKSECR